jgi:LacI family transcriptional regulator
MVQKKKTVTLKDIARRAEVSTGTVSFVLTNTHEKRRISRATVERVRKIAREMGYHPNIAARNLRQVDPKERMLVLAILTSLESPLTLVGHVLEGLHHKIHQRNRNRRIMINIATFQQGELNKVPGILEGAFFNAAIITNTSPEDDAFLQNVELPYPNLVIGREIPGYSCFIPSYGAGNLAAETLIQAGCHSTAVIYPKVLTQATRSRVDQYCETMIEKTGFGPVQIACQETSEFAATDALSQYIIAGRSIDGLFAIHDNLAAGAYVALRNAGLKIPESVKVLGVGDSEWAPFLEPPLSCAGAEECKVYETAADMMLRQFEEKPASPEIVRINARLHERGSV